jgi:integrase
LLVRCCPEKQLTEANVWTLSEADGAPEYQDAEQPGLPLRVDGCRSFIVRYSFLKKQYKVKIGRLKAGWTLKEARKRAAQIMGAVRNDVDPFADARDTGDPSFADVVDRWEKTLPDEDGNLTAWKRRIPGMVRKDCEHWLQMPISKISAPMVATVLEDAKERATGGGRMANALQGVIGQVFRFAKGKGIVKFNPAEDIAKVGNDGVRDRFFNEAEIAKLWEAFNKAGAEGNPLKLLMTTGQRRGEVYGMKWADVDLDAGEWFMPKTKNGKPHNVPLTKAMIALLPERGADEHVFKDWRSGERGPWERAREASGVKDAHEHDMRRSVITTWRHWAFRKTTVCG